MNGEVEVVDALGVKPAARVVVDDVDQDGEPIQVADVDERLALVHLAAELLRRERRMPLVVQQRVDVRYVRGQIRGVDAVVHLG
jgi:hypothetical protein